MSFFRHREKNENIIWQKASPKDINDIISFLTPEEHSCISITSRLLTNGKPDADQLRRNEVYMEKTDDKIVNLILLSEDSIISPFFNSDNSTHFPREILSKSSIFRKKYLTLMGPKKDLLQIEPVFSDRNRLSIDYYQLAAHSRDIPENVADYLLKKESPYVNLTVKNADDDDLSSLMPLRKAYEIEEVVIDQAHFNEPACRTRFRKALLKKRVFFASCDGIPIATCCINSEGMKWYQIGGVYTVPTKRSMGISAMLMSSVASHTASIGKDLTLFVKKGNTPALKLYKNCGFRNTGEFRITYAERR